MFLIPDVLGLHADVIVTSSVLKEYLEENKENTYMHKDARRKEEIMSKHIKDLSRNG